MKKLDKLPLYIVALFQSLSLIAYISLVGLLMSRTEHWFDQVPDFIGISFFLTIFTTSALISVTITLGYPAYLFWKNKKMDQSIKLIVYTIIWLIFFILSFAASRILV